MAVISADLAGSLYPLRGARLTASATAGRVVRMPTRRICRYDAPKPGTYSTLSVPEGAEVVHFAADGDGRLSFWAVVPLYEDTGTLRRETPFRRWRTWRTFGTISTGSELRDDEVYRGTVVEPPFVWHLVERIEVDD